MLKMVKYRLFPTKKQVRKLNETLEECRWLYNHLLEMRKTAYERDGLSLTCFQQQSTFPVLKQERPSLNGVHSQVLQNVAVRIDLACKAFFRRCKAGTLPGGQVKKPGYPRFKGYDRYDSFTFPQSGFSITHDHCVMLSKIGSVKMVYHRALKGKVKTCSTGEEIANPRFFRKEEKALAKVQRKHSQLAKGTPERRKQRKVVARVHERIKFRRDNFTHQESRQIVDRYGVICVEDLHVNRMLHNHCLSKSIVDASWSEFLSKLSCKAEEAGRQFVKVNPDSTSQTCSRCGHRQKMPLSERIFACLCCHVHLDRDLNASRNILSIGRYTLGLAREAPAF